MLNLGTHLLLDAARMNGEVEVAKKLNEAHDSLYRGGPEELYTGIGPYLFTFQKGLLSEWYMKNGWGHSWGILFKSASPLPDLYLHFRKFIHVALEDGQNVFFRFYDPRVLRTFLPTCDTQQIREFFGPVQYFIMEDEDPSFALQFWHENGVCMSKQLDMRYLKQEVTEDASLVVSTNKEDALSVIPKSHSTQLVEANSDAGKSSKEHSVPTRKWNTFD